MHSKNTAACSFFMCIMGPDYYGMLPRNSMFPSTWVQFQKGKLALSLSFFTPFEHLGAT